jgi:hypothetical protein
VVVVNCFFVAPHRYTAYCCVARCRNHRCLLCQCSFVSLCDNVFNNVDPAERDQENVRPSAVFVLESFVGPLVSLQFDRVPNVRIALARCLSKHFVNRSMFAYQYFGFLSWLIDRSKSDDLKRSRYEQVHSCRSEDALAQKRCEINAEGRGDGSKKNGRKVVKN